MAKSENIIDSKLLFKQLKYEPHEHQWDIHNSKARFRIPCCGRRFGKTQVAGHEMTKAMFVPNSYYWIVGPTYKLGEKEFRVVYDDLIRKLQVKGCRKSYNVPQGQMRIQTPWNSILEVVSAEKQDSLVGEGLDGAIISEAALHQMSTWEQFVEPALSDKRGWAIFPSTPRGNNWYRGLYEIGQDPNEDLYESWRLPTWYNTIMFPEGYDDPEIQRIKRKVTEHKFQQEYAAEFSAFQGKIYPEFDARIHVKDIQYNPFWRNYYAFDFGFADPLVCLDIMVDASDNVYVWREYQVSFKNTYEHGEYLRHRKNPEGYHVDNAYGDPRGADEISTLEMILGISIQAHPIGWSRGIEAVGRWVKLDDRTRQPKLFIDRSCTSLIRQMENLRAKEGKEGKNVKDGQVDYDDHGPDALRYFFGEHFILGASGSLADAYNDGYVGSEAEGFFKMTKGITLESTIGW